MYGAQTWSATKGHIQRIRRTQYAMLRTVTGIKLSDKVSKK